MGKPLDLLTGTQDAIIQLIREQLPVDRREMVRHSLDENFQPPFHLVGDITTEEAGGKEEQLEELEAEIHTVYRGNDRRELLALMHELRLATHHVRVPLDGATYTVQWRSAIASAAARDGVTYAGLTTLDIIAEPADPE
jgi:hypothetical protein